MFDLSGKHALVTGASGGIGGAIARNLHAGGAHVAISGTRVDALDALAGELGDRAYPLTCDLADREATSSLPQRAAEAMGGLDILVNNAGITRDNLMLRLSEDDWETVISVNLSAAMRLMKSSIRTMIRKRQGRIVNIVSVVGLTGNSGQANYAASKAGMIGLAKSLAQEIGSRGVTVNCVAPGFIVSAMTDRLPDDVAKRYSESIPAGRFGSVDEVAAAVRFLVSDEASYVTGQTIHVNGGMLMV